MSPETVTLDGFPSVLARGWTWGRRVLWAGLTVAAAMVLLNALYLYDLLARVHPVVARSASAVVALALLGFAFWALRRYLAVPRVLSPPDLPPAAEGWSEAQARRYVAFAVAYLRRQQRNPHLPEDSALRVPGAIALIEGAASSTAPELDRIVQRELDVVLRPLDDQAKKLIRRAAVEVATATAVSPSVLLDALITLTRNIDLISRLADLYYGRPGLLGTLRIVRDVVGSAVAAGALEVVSDHLSGALAEMTGSWTSRLIGPLGQGMINGVVTMRFGAAARWRCRSLKRGRVPWRPWDLSQYRRAIGSLMDWISEDAGPTVLDPFRRAADWTGRTLRKFGLGSTEPGPRMEDDPLVQAGLLD